MNQEVKVSFYLKKNEMKEDGTSPVMARLTVGKSETTFSTKMNAPTSLWVSGRATGKSRVATVINKQLDEIRANALSYYQELSSVKISITAEMVKNLLLGMACEQETLLAYFQKFNKNFEKRVGVNRKKGSLDSYKYALNKLTAFINEKYKLSDIPFTALVKSFIDKYDLYLRIECKIELGTIVLLTTRLGTIINNAIADGIITADPFAGYVAQRPIRRQKYLTKKEIDKLMTTPLTCPKHYLIRDMFLFSCYTGMSFSDMRELTKDKLSIASDGTVWIKNKREKTGVKYEIPLMELPLLIIERYQDIASKERLLPMYDNRETNIQLKQIAKTCGIEKWLTFHCARHTYASEITLSQGVPIETVSKMLGHTQITTTQIYAKITDEKIDEDMKTLDKRISNKFKFTI
ncbi:site-specific integrase [Bacteroides sp. 224]|uniref:site-specific integrase n=1 Tax=Bacteroides sp. 224 TaxID=2302936 RepID=UPI0013D18E67|nr:site-specific integrase [Bacteroides sp. 224]NDV64703.1 site-specific integrase [Bacteroides sp. 224]